MLIIGILENSCKIGFDLKVVNIMSSLLLSDLKDKHSYDLDLTQTTGNSLLFEHVRATRMPFFIVWAWPKQLQVVFFFSFHYHAISVTLLDI